VDEEGNIWFPDVQNSVIRIYNDKGKQLRSFGKGQLFQPAYLAIDQKNNRLAVVNQQRDKIGISVFTLAGKLERTFGTKGMGGGKLWAPTGIDIMEDGGIVVADGINSIINVFDPTGTLKYHLKDEDGKKIVQIGSARGIRVEGERVWVASSIINEVEVLEMFGQPEIEQE
jgi:DNA-binding beta-propeller fold protein YncE